jgi:hypothetical protein
MVKRFGPTRGAGTVVEEQEGDKSIAPGALGWAGYAGILERGPVNELMLISSKSELLAMTGGVIPDSLLPDAAQDYFNVANGAGGLALVRVTDGTERPAGAFLLARSLKPIPIGILYAHNGGKWGGREHYVAAELAEIDDLTNVTLQLPSPHATRYGTDHFRGGYVELAAVDNVRYPIIASTKEGLIVVASDQKMREHLDAQVEGSSLQFYVVLKNDSKGLSFRVADGEERPDSEFSIELFLNGAPVNKKWGNLHTDSQHPRYWVDVINGDTSNFYVRGEPLWEGAHTADTRPANYYGQATTFTETRMTLNPVSISIDSDTAANPTVEVELEDGHLPDVLTLTMTSATAGTFVSERFGDMGSFTDLETGTPNRYVPEVEITQGSTPLAAGDRLTIRYLAFAENSLVGGTLYPDKKNHKNDGYRIVANTYDTITVAPGADLTEYSTPSEYMIVVPVEFVNGADGNADVSDATFEAVWDVDSSPFNSIDGQGLGLVKLATPGVTSVAAQKAGRAYAEAKNHQYRYEAPANVLTEAAAISLVNDTLGRSDHAVLAVPSFAYVPDPDPAYAREARQKLISSTGMIHGREARIAVDFDGYHKAQAGIDATLPRILRLPSGEKRFNEELLNPAGIAVIKKKQGNFVIWGDRTLHRDPTWRWKHQREQMSYYEQVLRDSFDFLIFAINDPLSDKLAHTALITFFMPEWVKRALRGAKFQDAAIIKVDSEINTDATRANGEKYAEVSLRLADTVERFIIKIGKQGIFESVA